MSATSLEARLHAAIENPNPEEWLSDAADPLDRLSENALFLARSCWIVLGDAQPPIELEGIAPCLSFHVPIFVARLRAVSQHKGPEWRRLREANLQPATIGRHTAGSHADLAGQLGIGIYIALAEATGDSVAARKCVGGEFTELQVDALHAVWGDVINNLRDVDRDDCLLLEQHISKELLRARQSTDGEGPAVKRLPLESRAKKLPLESRALAVLIHHPEWSNKRIAQEVGCHTQSLYRVKSFMAARDELKKSGTDAVPRGSKIDGGLEAWDISE